MAYLHLMQDPEMLQVQMHGYAAATGDPRSPPPCRRTFEVLWHMVKDKLGLDQEMIQDFFANGMLISVMSAIDLLSVKESWANRSVRVRKVRRHDAISEARRAMVTSQRHKRHDDPIFFFLSQDSDYSQLTIPFHQEVTRWKRKGKEHTNDHHTEPADRRRVH